jgi:pyruvate,water dikinase
MKHCSGSVLINVTHMPIIPFNQIEPGDLSRVGGKGLNLGLMLRAGLPVPDGFCLTENVPNAGDNERGGETEALLAAYDRLGAGLVAVRSSAAVEDGAEHSFAGQQETILGVRGNEQLLDAVERCFQSWHSARSQAYRAHKGLAEDSTAMAVVVQKLVAADVAGVLFTRDPLDPTGQRMLAEAAWGLGELVVSGRVTPDRFFLNRSTLALERQEISRKPISVTADGIRDVEPHLQSQPCLDAAQLRELAEFGLRVEQFYGNPRDIEWAWAEGRIWLLQSRPVTTAGALEKEEFRKAEIARLRGLAAPTGTAWARYNLAEVLARPTPMTWAIVRRFMSGRGGYGLMFRDLGFDPDPQLDDEGFIDLVCGRPYVNLSREPKLYFRDFPYGYDFAALKQRPAASFYPQPGVNPSLATGRMWLKLPLIIYRIFRAQARMRRQIQTLARELRERVFPEFAKEVATARETDLAGLSSAELHERLQFWTARTLVEFARVALRPSMFAAEAMTTLGTGLKAIVAPERAPVVARELLTGVRPDPETDLAAAIRALAEGSLSREEFLSRFGHRGPQEMELSQPRWAEDPHGLPIPELRGPSVERDAPSTPVPSPTPDENWSRLVAAHPHRRYDIERLEPVFRTACEFLRLRESAKHYLLQGYALIREALLEFDRRFHLKGGIFYLTPDELPPLLTGEPLDSRIAARRKERQLALAVEAPAVLFSDDLEAIGCSPPLADGTAWEGTPVSAGTAEGQALVLTEPVVADDQQRGFILVCPSTDPAWVPLFLKCAGVVMETGGILSHGAIVAREFGLPAVVGMPDACRRLQTGQRLRVDGNSGKIHLLEETDRKPQGRE